VRRALGAVALVVLLAGCGDDHDDGGGTTTTTEATSTTEAATTTEGTTTTTPACDAIEPAAGQPDLVDTTADVDGDGEPDHLRSYRAGGEAPGTTFAVQVELAAGGGASLELPGDGVTTVEVLGGADVDRDGDAEIWARTGAGASATIISLLTFEDCALAPVTIAAGGRAEFPIGGSVGTTAGLECGSIVDPEAHLVVYSASNVAGDEYEVTATKYRLAGTVLSASSSEPEVGNVQDPDFERIARFHCGDLVL
jgi:hypothetical protein